MRGTTRHGRWMGEAECGLAQSLLNLPPGGLLCPDGSASFADQCNGGP